MGAVVVGRAEETQRVERAVAEVAAGIGSFVHIVGDAGLGKSTLLAIARTALERRSIPVHTAVADETDRRRPHALIRALVPPRSPLEPDPIGAAVAGVEQLTAHGPVALLADDVHWADDASVDSIRAIARRTVDLGALLITTARPHPQSDSLGRLDAIAENSAARVTLESLTEEDLAALATSRFGGAPGPNLTRAMSSTSGNPFLAVELLAEIESDGALTIIDGTVELDGDVPLSGDLGERLARRVLRNVAGLNVARPGVADGELTLRAAAVLPGGFSVDELAALTDQPVLAVVRAALDAVAADVLIDLGSTLAFRHELLRRAVLGATPAPVVQALRRRAADVLRVHRADAGRLTECLLESCDPDDPRDRDRLIATSREVRSTNPVAAAELLRAAFDGAVDIDGDLALELGWAQLAAGQARQIGAVLARSPPRHGARLVEERRLRGIAMSITGRLHELIERSGTVDVDALTGELDLTDAVEVDAAAELGLLLVSGERPDQAGRLLQWVDRSPTPVSPFRQASMSTVRAWRAVVEGSFEDAAAHARTALAAVAADPTRNATPGSPLIVGALALDFLGDGEAAVEMLRGRDLTTALPRWTPPLLQYSVGVVLFRRGEWDDALAEIDAGLVAADEVDLGMSTFWPFAIGALVGSARGDRAATSEWLARAATMPASGALGAEWMGYARAAAAEAAGDVQGANVMFGAMAYRIIAAGVPALLMNIGPDAVRLALVAGQTAAAVSVCDALAELTSRTSSPVAAATAAWTAGLLSADHATIAAAAEQLDGCMRMPAASRARHDAAVIAARHGHHDEARRLAGIAFTAYDTLGAEHWHARLRADLRACGIPMRPRRRLARATHGWESLTPSEQKVIALVGEGATNTEIAERLFISRRTVESHLGRTYRKLDITTRSQLAAAAARRNR